MFAKHLPVADVAQAGGWRNVTTLPYAGRQRHDPCGTKKAPRQGLSGLKRRETGNETGKAGRNCRKLHRLSGDGAYG